MIALVHVVLRTSTVLSPPSNGPGGKLGAIEPDDLQRRQCNSMPVALHNKEAYTGMTKPLEWVTKATRLLSSVQASLQYD